MKIRPLGADMFHANRQTGGETGMMKPVFVFCDFAKVSVKVKFTLEQATKFQTGSGRIALLFL